MNLDVGLVTTALRRPGTYAGQLREAATIARALALYPLGLPATPVTTGRPAGDPALDTPVLLVHGYGHNRSGWFDLQRQLVRSGFTSVHTLNYNPLRHDVPELAAQLAARVEAVTALTGAAKINVVGHSLGGILLRWYVQELGGDVAVDTAVTVASPHEGTVSAWIGQGRAARQLLPGSPVIRRLHDGARPTDVRWIAYYTNLDLVVQPCRSALLTDPTLGARNILVKDEGHMSIMRSRRLARSITEELTAPGRGVAHAPATLRRVS